MKKYSILVVLCLMPYAAQAMLFGDHRTTKLSMKLASLPPHFFNISCPEQGEYINKEQLLASNPTWKQISETASQEEKDNNLQKAFNLQCSTILTRLSWPTYRKRLICALTIGARIDLNDNKGETVLHKAVKKDDYEFVKFAFKCGANPNIYIPSPLFFATNVKMAQLLMAHKINMNQNLYDNTVLHVIAQNNRFPADLIPYYTQQGCNVNTQNMFGNTPLMELLSGNFNEDKFQLLLEAGSDPTIKNQFKQTALSMAEVDADINFAKNNIAQQIQNYYQQCKSYLSLINRLRLFGNKP